MTRPPFLQPSQRAHAGVGTGPQGLHIRGGGGKQGPGGGDGRDGAVARPPERMWLHTLQQIYKTACILSQSRGGARRAGWQEGLDLLVKLSSFTFM